MAKPILEDTSASPLRPPAREFLQPAPASRLALNDWWEGEVSRRLEEIDRKLEEILIVQRNPGRRNRRMVSLGRMDLPSPTALMMRMERMEAVVSPPTSPSSARPPLRFLPGPPSTGPPSTTSRPTSPRRPPAFPGLERSISPMHATSKPAPTVALPMGDTDNMPEPEDPAMIINGHAAGPAPSATTGAYDTESSNSEIGVTCHASRVSRVSLGTTDLWGSSGGDQLDSLQAQADYYDVHPHLLVTSEEAPQDCLSVTASHFARTSHDMRESSIARFATRRASLSQPPTRLTPVWRFLEDPESGPLARIYDRCVPTMILVTVAVTVLQQVDHPPIDNFTAAVMEVLFESLFGLEIILWFIVTPAKIAHLRSVYTVIDILSVLPLVLRAFRGVIINIDNKDREDMTIPVLLGFVPVIRLLKVLRRFQKFHLLLKAFAHALEALPVFLFIYASLVLVFSTVIYMVEPPDNIPTLPEAIWLTVVSMATLGYGDIVPVSTYGRCASSILVFLTSLYMAIPLGIIGNAFSELWVDRDRVLLAEKVRSKLRQAGYTENDFVRALRLFDRDGNGVLDINEFSAMVTQLNLGLSRERTMELFRLADSDNSGEVDHEELVAMIFRYDGMHSSQTTTSGGNNRRGSSKELPSGSIGSGDSEAENTPRRLSEVMPDDS